MDSIEKEFIAISVKHLDMILYYPKDAMRIIKRCKELNKKILGIDAFIVGREKIQPSLDNSIDFSLINTNCGFWDEAVKFIEQRINDRYVFEIVYST